ncbi:MAG: SDR family oxidoreductase [Gemmatimonadota bacterium]|nr:SDR family oxidoreductase [Gemmatimonadota bacterium]
MRETILFTGATGLIGRGVLQRMLHADANLTAYVLVRDELQWKRGLPTWAALASRITAVSGDVRSPGLGIDPDVRSSIAGEVSAIVHAAANTRFSQSLEESRLSNTVGTANLLELASECRELKRFAFVSTAFVAGRATGTILERDNGTEAGWVNAYEQSKYEAECLVRSSEASWVIFRPTTVVCRGADGTVAQVNGVHRALRIYHRGLAAMMPGARENMFDVITGDYVNDAIAHLALDDRADGRTVHLCSGTRALTVGELLDTAYDVWERDAEWKRRGLSRAILTDLATYAMFERAVLDTGDARLRGLISSLSHFVPQLALPKQFDTSAADELLTFVPPSASEYWGPMLQNLISTGWGVTEEAAA